MAESMLPERRVWRWVCLVLACDLDPFVQRCSRCHASTYSARFRTHGVGAVAVGALLALITGFVLLR
jgi:hypothetical protein